MIAVADIPVEPDAPEARRWVLEELSRPEYREAEPTWFDRLAVAVRDWLADLLSGSGGLSGDVVLALVVVLVIAAVVVGLLVFGVPRLRRRRRASATPLFDDGDTRTLAELRRAADAAAAAGRYDLAVEERFRAIVRALADRELLRPSPGTTAHGFARSATTAFPTFSDRLADAADAFDAVRYLGRAGTADEASRLASLDRDLGAAAPATPAGLAGLAREAAGPADGDTAVERTGAPA
ncbi:DUF4129 domain-containing protein [Agromyces agglutinans]|uniref:DUF4129 domain-containing protein n=1 Tax=Agromyces agglutinans TaxID=2662258 RepID=UPI0028A7629D|nr:DUF4129 domain-containing protein [Agromyces agglutinans]